MGNFILNVSVAVADNDGAMSSSGLRVINFQIITND